MFSAFFIDRPKFALVISLVLSIMGAIAYLVLPVEQFPEITPPVVNVSATYTGANAETVENSVAAPIVKVPSRLPCNAVLASAPIPGQARH